MALSSRPWTPEMIAELDRARVFASLHRAHAKAWEKPFHNASDFHKFYAWRMAWWRELEKAFPDYIKDGVATCSFLSLPRLAMKWHKPQRGQGDFS